MASAFFPDGCFSNELQLDEFWRGYHTDRLQAGGERSLHSYEMTPCEMVLQYFLSEGAGIIVRIEHANARTQFVAKKLKLEHPGTIHEAVWSYTEIRRALQPREWRSIVNVLGACDYWDMPSSEEVVGLDGYHCIVEVRQHDRYHLVDRWSPHRNRFAELCELLTRHWERVVQERVARQYHPSPPWWRFS